MSPSKVRGRSVEGRVGADRDVMEANIVRSGFQPFRPHAWGQSPSFRLFTFASMQEKKRWIAAAAAVLLLASCSHDSRPDEKRAKVELQRVLDGMNYGVWRVDRVTRTNGRMTTRGGPRADVLEGDVERALVKAMR